ncbi:MAG: zinc ribbon domain-containing protein [Candidatus Omnitrophica bacterium]|nr:zinc ribbon domain-containing protein [Candidatus Omnitrophota bacterium]
MPTYEYECRSCGHQFEKFQPITARPSTLCPKCRRTSRRLISAGGGVLFKGSGFYITDYRSASYKKRASEEAKGSSSCSGKSPSSCASGAGSCSAGTKGNSKA